MNYLHTRLGGFHVSTFPRRLRRIGAELHRSLHILRESWKLRPSPTFWTRIRSKTRGTEFSPLRTASDTTTSSSIFHPASSSTSKSRRSTGSGEWGHCRGVRTSIRICIAC
ncbi:uncharacterized protein [Blastocystis hominis]|uniref:Uncharacterized protein n=1 Tax=Blastocystis hominis TaxID=12968 RepID=D8M5N9_BLAHO|nr:uncharacterized protein [Blastocystis hominis]CBK23378.2 unnamed protein product [Blastocystis hominis]|eukprot:XP_012897426.1 uncharacterized protein [Blastocystis hominis]